MTQRARFDREGLTDAQILAIAYQLRTAYGMKRILRYATARDFTRHNESDAEHVFGLLFLSEYFLPLEDPHRLLNRVRVHQIILFHDFPEMKYGDVVMNQKTLEHEAREKEAAPEIFARLPKPLNFEGLAAWKEYEARDSPEARFVYALDKVEPLFELLDEVNEKSLQRLGYTYESHTRKKFEATEKFPTMRRFVEVISEDFRRRGLFIDQEAS